MVSIEISIEDISHLLGYEKPLTPSELNELLAYAIAEVDSDPEGPDENGHTKITIDIKTSNRPDLWGVEGIVRVLRGMMDEPGLPPLDAEPSGFVSVYVSFVMLFLDAITCNRRAHRAREPSK